MATKCETYAAELVALKAKTPVLKQNMDNMTPLLLGYIDSFQNNYGTYNCGEDLALSLANFKNLIQGDSYNSPNFVNSTINTITFNEGSCKGGSTNCTKDGCIASIKTVNNTIADYFHYRKLLVANLNDIKNKEAQYQNDPECKIITLNEAEQNIIDQDRNRTIRNGIIWFLVVSAVIGVLIWLDKKYFHIVLK